MCRARRGEARSEDLGLARCSERIYFSPSGFLSAPWLPARPRGVASAEITMDVTNVAGFRDGYAASPHAVVTNFCRQLREHTQK